MNTFDYLPKDKVKAGRRNLAKLKLVCFFPATFYSEEFSVTNYARRQRFELRLVMDTVVASLQDVPPKFLPPDIPFV